MDIEYTTVKTLHQITVGITGLLFASYGYWFAQQKTIPKLLRIVPHVNDTVLFVSGIYLVHVIGIANWLGLKLGLIVVYILLGLFAVRRAKTRAKQLLFWASALATYGVVFSLAAFKPSL